MISIKYTDLKQRLLEAYKAKKMEINLSKMTNFDIFQLSTKIILNTSDINQISSEKLRKAVRIIMTDIATDVLICHKLRLFPDNDNDIICKDIYAFLTIVYSQLKQVNHNPINSIEIVYIKRTQEELNYEQDLYKKYESQTEDMNQKTCDEEPTDDHIQNDNQTQREDNEEFNQDFFYKMKKKLAEMLNHQTLNKMSDVEKQTLKQEVVDVFNKMIKKTESIYQKRDDFYQKIYEGIILENDFEVLINQLIQIMNNHYSDLSSFKNYVKKLSSQLEINYILIELKTITKEFNTQRGLIPQSYSDAQKLSKNIYDKELLKQLQKKEYLKNMDLIIDKMKDLKQNYTNQDPEILENNIEKLQKDIKTIYQFLFKLNTIAMDYHKEKDVDIIQNNIKLLQDFNNITVVISLLKKMKLLQEKYEKQFALTFLRNEVKDNRLSEMQYIQICNQFQEETQKLISEGKKLLNTIKYVEDYEDKLIFNSTWLELNIDEIPTWNQICPKQKDKQPTSNQNKKTNINIVENLKQFLIEILKNIENYSSYKDYVEQNNDFKNFIEKLDQLQFTNQDINYMYQFCNKYLSFIQKMKDIEQQVEDYQRNIDAIEKRIHNINIEYEKLNDILSNPLSLIPNDYETRIENNMKELNLIEDKMKKFWNSEFATSFITFRQNARKNLEKFLYLLHISHVLKDPKNYIFLNFYQEISEKLEQLDESYISIKEKFKQLPQNISQKQLKRQNNIIHNYKKRLNDLTLEHNKMIRKVINLEITPQEYLRQNQMIGEEISVIVNNTTSMIEQQIKEQNDLYFELKTLLKNAEDLLKNITQNSINHLNVSIKLTLIEDLKSLQKLEIEINSDTNPDIKIQILEKYLNELYSYHYLKYMTKKLFTSQDFDASEKQKERLHAKIEAANAVLDFIEKEINLSTIDSIIYFLNKKKENLEKEKENNNKNLLKEESPNISNELEDNDNLTNMIEKSQEYQNILSVNGFDKEIFIKYIQLQGKIVSIQYSNAQPDIEASEINIEIQKIQIQRLNLITQRNLILQYIQGKQLQERDIKHILNQLNSEINLYEESLSILSF